LGGNGLIISFSKAQKQLAVFISHHFNQPFFVSLCGIIGLRSFMFEFKTIALFVITAIAEIMGCYLPYLWLKQDKSILLLIPAALSLSLFAWLLTLHPTATGRVYAAYGGVYIFVALLWLWTVDGVKPTVWDLIGGFVAVLGMAIIMFAPKNV
jgi:small multidrug resistance family-3 protein